MGDPRTYDVRRLIQGRSDQQISAEVQRQGVDAVLSRVFSMIATAFIPEAAAIESAVVHFEVAAPDGIHCYQLHFADDKCVAAKADREPAPLTVSNALPELLRLVGGEVDGMESFVTGRIRLSGDVLLAQAMPSWFHRQSNTVALSSF
jgi:putative sterol carrier protein